MYRFNYPQMVIEAKGLWSHERWCFRARVLDRSAQESVLTDTLFHSRSEDVMVGLVGLAFDVIQCTYSEITIEA